jgi:hypothetical protein
LRTTPTTFSDDAARLAGPHLPAGAHQTALKRASDCAGDARFGGSASWTHVEHLAVATQSRVAVFEFESGIAGEAEQDRFKADFARELERLEQWSAEYDWLSFKRAVPKLTVVVSERFNISKSLVPAWNGWAGHMEFPARRVLAGKAAVLHELVHVLIPSGNRFLAEGLAVHLQAEIGGNPAFPNFGAPLHALAGERMREMAGQLATDGAVGLKAAPGEEIFAAIRLGELDAIATPSPLTLHVGEHFYGEEPHGQACIYPIVGSFVRFLIETRGVERFRRLYLETPLMPLRQNAGPPDRWAGVYGVSLADLEQEWKSLIAGKIEL